MLIIIVIFRNLLAFFVAVWLILAFFFTVLEWDDYTKEGIENFTTNNTYQLTRFITLHDEKNGSILDKYTYSKIDYTYHYKCKKWLRHERMILSIQYDDNYQLIKEHIENRDGFGEFLCKYNDYSIFCNRTCDYYFSKNTDYDITSEKNIFTG